MSTSDIHLKIDGIKGESTDARHRDEIVVDSWTWGVANAAPPAGGGGGGAGKPSFSDLSFTHRVDRASPLIRQTASATGSPGCAAAPEARAPPCSVVATASIRSMSTTSSAWVS